MLKHVVMESPSVLEAEEFLKSGIGSKSFVIVTGSCKVSYEGRAKSELGLGDRVVLLKSDGSFLVHQDKKREPVNWQPPGCNVECGVSDGRVFLRSVRRRPFEVLVVEFFDLYMITCFMVEDFEEVSLVGSEGQMVDYIFRNPDVIEEGFKPVGREEVVSSGVIDVLGEDVSGNLVVLEVKRVRATLGAVSQLKRYVDVLRVDGKSVRGVLVAPSITGGALRLLEDFGLEFKVLDPPNFVVGDGCVTLESF